MGLPAVAVGATYKRESKNPLFSILFSKYSTVQWVGRQGQLEAIIIILFAIF